MPNYKKNEDYEKVSIFRKYKTKENSCPSNTTQEVSITVPVAVNAFANLGTISIDCVGCPVIDEKEFKPTCEHSSTSHFTITQKILVKIPIVFEAEVEVGEEHVYFEEPKKKCDNDDNNEDNDNNDEDDDEDNDNQTLITSKDAWNY